MFILNTTHMLEHRYRFHGHGSLRRLYQQGRSYRNRSVAVRALPNPNRVHSRITVIVAKKVYKHAVKRNRIRRRLYEVIRTHWDELKHPADIAITVFDKNLLIMPYNEVEETILGVLRDANLLENPKK